jgi:hypothetical protein
MVAFLPHIQQNPIAAAGSFPPNLWFQNAHAGVEQLFTGRRIFSVVFRITAWNQLPARHLPVAYKPH